MMTGASDFPILATTIKSVELGQDKFWQRLRHCFESGHITDIFILCPGKPTGKNKKSYRALLRNIGASWLSGRLVYPINGEEIQDTREFLARAIRAYDITHFADNNKFNLEAVVANPELTDIKISAIHADEPAKLISWIYDTSGSFYDLLHGPTSVSPLTAAGKNETIPRD